MRNAFAQALYDLAVEDEGIYVLAADISPAGPMARFRDEFPKRFINVGVAEQVMVGMAAGLALRGLKPFVYTIATFALYRPFEFVRDDLAYQCLPVTIVGMGAGVIYSTLGSTHHAQEDVALASAIPNMQIISPCDPDETVEAVKYCASQQKGPVYLRLGKAGEPNLTKHSVPWKFGSLRVIRAGKEGCILTYGPISQMAVSIGDLKDFTVVSCHTLKPLDRGAIATLLSSYNRVIVIEEHSERGGLASWVKEIAWETKATCKLDTFSLKDEFIHHYGSHAELLEKHGLSKNNVVAFLQQ